MTIRLTKIILSVISLFVISVVSCKNNDKSDTNIEELKQSYWLYSSIIQVVDKNNEEYEFKFSANKLTKRETDTLIMILERKKYNYKVTIDSQVMISKISAPTIDNLSFIESELRETLHDTSNKWKWK